MMHAFLTIVDLICAALCAYWGYKAAKMPDVYPRWYVAACIFGFVFNLFVAML